MVLQENRLTDANPVIAATAGARLRPCLYGENLSRVEGSLAYPIYRWANQFWRTVYMHEKQKVGCAKMVPV